jgi:hypothetical protein
MADFVLVGKNNVCDFLQTQALSHHALFPGRFKRTQALTPGVLIITHVERMGSKARGLVSLD